MKHHLQTVQVFFLGGGRGESGKRETETGRREEGDRQI